MAKDATFSARIDGDLKQHGDKIFHSLGVKPSQALSIFYSQVVMHGGFPFEVKIPNEETLEAMREIRDPEFRKNAPRYDNAEELFSALRS